MEDYEGSFYPTMPNIDGRDEFERLLRGDIGMPGIGRTATLLCMPDTRCFFAREACRGCKTLPWLEPGRPRQPVPARLK